MAKMLLDHGACAESSDLYGYTPLLNAAETGDTELMHLLMEHGANVAVVSTSGRNVLHVYMTSGSPNPAMYLTLVAKGADPLKRDRDGSDSLGLALFDYKFASFILNGCFNLDCDFSRLYFDPDILRLLKRKYGGDTLLRALSAEPEGEEWSPLCLYSSAGEKEIVNILLDCGAKVDFRGCRYGTALVVACAAGKLDVVKLLVRQGAELSAYRRSRTPVRYSQHGSIRENSSWLLMYRYTEQGKLEGGRDAGGTPNIVFRPWSGKVSRSFCLTGARRKRCDESLIDYAVRLGDIKKKMQGEILPETLTAQPDWAPRLQPTELVRVHPDDTRRPKDDDAEIPIPCTGITKHERLDKQARTQG